MKIYRGIYDLQPSEINPVFISQGSFGEGTHYAFDEESALAYCLDAKKFGILYEAEVEIANDLELHSNNVEGLKGYRGDTQIKSSLLGIVDKEFLMERVKELGFDSCSLRGTIDGGEQLIILNPNIKVSIVSYKLILPNSHQLIESTDLKWNSCPFDSNFKISKSLTEDEINKHCSSI